MLIVHYGEIGTKGKNRIFFEKKLVESIRKTIDCKIQREYGRIVAGLPEKYSEKKIAESLKSIPGIAYFAFCREAELSIDDIKMKALQTIKGKKAKTFKVETKRSNKQFPLTSLDVNRDVGKYIEKNTKMEADLSNPQGTVYIEICQKRAYVYTKKIRGEGGMPIGSAGRVISLLSGGIDSPVASYLMIRRGCTITYVHFHNYEHGRPEKIEGIVRKLHKHSKAKIYSVPFRKIQMEIMKSIPSEYRMIIYRRMMFRIAEKILEREKAKGFVTGDNLAQVASQTLDNLNVIYDAVSYPVYSPLIGMDKEQIIKLAEKIGTYKLSILPYSDCCSFMIARHPKTKSDVKTIKRLEKNLKVNKLVSDAFKEAEIFK